MKKSHIFTALISLLLSFDVVGAEITGLWKTFDDENKPTGYVRIIEEQAVYSAVIEKGLESDTEEQFCTACKDERKDQKLVGMIIMKGVVVKGDDHFQGPEILDPFSGNTYRVKLQLKDMGETLEVRGYVGISLFGRTQLWRRAENGQ